MAYDVIARGAVPAGSATGSYTVSWDASATAGVTYVLEESATADFAAAAPLTLTPATVQTRAISGKAADAASIQAAAERAPEGVDVQADLQGSEDYKKHLLKVFAKRAMEAAAASVK